MKISRNDPCPCGSGKKYKKCCMKKDEERQRAQRIEKQLEYQLEDQNQLPENEGLLKSSVSGESPQPAKPAIANVPDPHTQALEARWKEFEAQNYEGRITLFLKTLEEPELMDDDMAFDMLDTIYNKTTEPEQRNRYDGLVEQLRERLPKVYAKSAHYYLENRITNAVIAGRFDQVPILMNELAGRAGKDIDIFNMVVEQLAYYGRSATLLEAFEIAWPSTEESPNIVPWGINEFADQAVKLLVFNHLEQHGAEATGHPKLFEHIQSYSDIEPERITGFLALLTGRSGRQWAREDFTFKARPHARDDGGQAISIPKAVRQNLFDLSLDFQGHLWREQNVPLTKGDLGRVQLVDYFIERLSGELEPSKSMLESVAHPNRPGPKKSSPAFYLSGDDDSIHWLCPDRKTLDAFIAKCFQLLNYQPYKATALFELVPAWLRFLESHQLVSASARLQTLRDLHGLSTYILTILRKTNSDPALQAAIESCSASWHLLCVSSTSGIK